MHIDDDILKKMGFNERGRMETENHIILIRYYDIWNLHINGKNGYSIDEIFIQDFFTVEHFVDVIRVLTGKELKTK